MIFIKLINKFIFSLILITKLCCSMRTNLDKERITWIGCSNIGWWSDLVYGLTVPSYLPLMNNNTGVLYIVSFWGVTVVHHILSCIFQRLFEPWLLFILYRSMRRWTKFPFYFLHHVTPCRRMFASVNWYSIWYTIFVDTNDMVLYICDSEGPGCSG